MGIDRDANLNKYEDFQQINHSECLQSTNGAKNQAMIKFYKNLILRTTNFGKHKNTGVSN